MEGFHFALKTFVHRLEKSRREMTDVLKNFETKEIDEDEALVQWMEIVSDTFNSTRRARSYIQRSLTFTRKRAALRSGKTQDGEQSGNGGGTTTAEY